MSSIKIYERRRRKGFRRAGTGWPAFILSPKVVKMLDDREIKNRCPVIHTHIRRCKKLRLAFSMRAIVSMWNALQ